MNARSAASSAWLSRYAWMCVLFTLALIFVGGMVTSKQAGMAVPDWPLSYGSINPAGWWQIENVRLEHGHRLIASALGLLIIGLTGWTWRAESRRWVRWLAVIALVGVVVQGILGGLRVTERSLWLAVFHGCLAQAFLAGLVVLAVALTPRRAGTGGVACTATFTRLSSLMIAVVYGQLVIGAVMRHFKAGLAIPDFPTAFGGWIPPLNTFPVIIHFSHRVGALIVFVTMVVLLVEAFRAARGSGHLLRPVCLLGALVVVQIVLGASVIWLAKAPVPTTFHVVNGALILATAVACRTRLFLSAGERQPEEKGAHAACLPGSSLAEGAR